MDSSKNFSTLSVNSFFEEFIRQHFTYSYVSSTGILKCRVSGQQRWRSDSSGCIMQVLTAFFSFCIFCPSLFILTDIWMFSLSFLYVYIYISVLCCLYIYIVFVPILKCLCVLSMPLS